MLEKLFDTLISPIILYGCEIWGPSSNFKNSDPYEHLHLKFIKEILGVHSKATNSACLTELNRQPLKVKIITQVIKFWEHIAHSNNTLVNEIYNNIPHNNKWLTSVHNWMKELGFNYIISDTHLLKSNLHNIKQRIIDQSIQNQISSLRNNRKLQFFNKIIQINKKPSYVDTIRFKSDRSLICRYRISSHSLAIERGRYKNIPANERICKSCQLGNVEDEKHFFIHCPAYTNFRKELINKVKIQINHFNQITENNISIIFNSKSLIILKAIAEYIKACQVFIQNI